MRQALERDDQQLYEAYRAVFASPLASEVLEDLRYTFLDIVGYEPGVSRPEDAVFFAGQRHVVTYILERLKPPTERTVIHEESA